MKRPPAIVREVSLAELIDERQDWKLDIPSEDISIDELVWHFGIPFWSTPGGFYDLKAQEVIDNPDRYPEAYGRILQADTSYPIDIVYWKGRWVIVDGLHRLAKHALDGDRMVKVRKIPLEDLPLRRKR